MSKFSTKIVKRGSIFGDFCYRYALLQKNKNVLTYYEHIFDFLKKSVPILFRIFTEKCRIDFSFRFSSFKLEASIAQW